MLFKYPDCGRCGHKFVEGEKLWEGDPTIAICPVCPRCPAGYQKDGKRVQCPNPTTIKPYQTRPGGHVEFCAACSD